MEALDCKGKDCNGEKVICKLVVYHWSQRKMWLDENRNCVVIFTNYLSLI